MNFLDTIWLIPLFPLAGALLMLLFGRRLPKSLIRILSPGAVLVSFIFAGGAVAQLAGAPGKTYEVIQFLWLPPVRADWGFLLDPLSSVMILIVTGISFLIHVYATGYMAHHGGFYRFFGYMNLFVFFMLLLVLANNYVLLFAGWEGVGLCSYLLIGFYYEKKSAADAGLKAFVVNRVGDAAFIIGILQIWTMAGSVRFTDVAHIGAVPAAALLLLIGAMGKSAQFPLHVWLPDAMEGPTPVSALIHAATMVTAGVYLVARSHLLFEGTPVSAIVAVAGAFTAIFAASIALVQNDIKRVLAYSTISQLGYMFLALGVGAYWIAVFHLFTHAFFKALLFLGAGSVIHGVGGEQDMRNMGGLRRAMPATHWTMLIGALAIAGVPGLAGFFSKDAILAQVYGSGQGSKALYAVGILTALITSVYMFRLLYLTFYGEARSRVEAHESPWSMTAPLQLLALGTVAVGWLAVPPLFGPVGFHTFEQWLAPVFGTQPSNIETPELVLIALSILTALAGWWIAKNTHLKVWDGTLHRTLAQKWFMDEIYDFLFVNGLAKGGGRLLGAFDRNILDEGVNGAAWITRVLSKLWIWWDTWVVDGAVRLTAFIFKLGGYAPRAIQNGLVQSYALVFFAGVLALLGYYAAR